MAARVKARGAGVVLSPKRLTPERVRAAVQAVLDDPDYRDAARTIQTEMRNVNGTVRAADLIESALGIAKTADGEGEVHAPPGEAAVPENRSRPDDMFDVRTHRS